MLLFIIITAILITTFLWIIGIIPKVIGVHTAKNYMKERYQHMYFKYENIEFSEFYNQYIVSFISYGNYRHSIRVYSKYLPVFVYEDINLMLNQYL